MGIQLKMIIRSNNGYHAFTGIQTALAQNVKRNTFWYHTYAICSISYKTSLWAEFIKFKPLGEQDKIIQAIDHVICEIQVLKNEIS